MQESILCLIERCGGEMDTFLRKNYLDSLRRCWQYILNISIPDTIHIISNLLSHNPYEFLVPVTPLQLHLQLPDVRRSGVQQVVFVFCICLSFFNTTYNIVALLSYNSYEFSIPHDGIIYSGA